MQTTPTPIPLPVLDLQAISDSAPSAIEIGRKERMEQEALEGDLKRAQEKKRHLQRIVLIFYYVAFSLVAILITSRVLHLVLPLHCQWLNGDQIQGIDKLLFSGAIGSFLGSYVKKSME